MTSASAARMVLVCGGIEAIYVLVRGPGLGEEKTYKSLWAIGLLTLGLSIFADFVPEVAGPFALLVLIAMAARSRGELGQVLGASRASSTSTRPRSVRREPSAANRAGTGPGVGG